MGASRGQWPYLCYSETNQERPRSKHRLLISVCRCGHYARRMGDRLMTNIQQQFELKRCEMCGEFATRLETHHQIPRYFGGKEDDTIQVCKSCHSKADQRFTKFLLEPFGETRGTSWHDEEKFRKYLREYTKNYYRAKNLFNYTIQKNVVCLTMMQYNKRTGNISISTTWQHRKNNIDYRLKPGQTVFEL